MNAMKKSGLKSRSRKNKGSGSADNTPATTTDESVTATSPRENASSSKASTSPTSVEVALNQKNYRLAKELNDIRVKYRDEMKNTARLKLENMNLASRCREAMSHVSILKKELAAQQRRSADILAIQRKQIVQKSNSRTGSTPSKQDVDVEGTQRAIAAVLDDLDRFQASPRDSLKQISREESSKPSKQVDLAEKFKVASDSSKPSKQVDSELRASPRNNSLKEQAAKEEPKATATESSDGRLRSSPTRNSLSRASDAKQKAIEAELDDLDRVFRQREESKQKGRAAELDDLDRIAQASSSSPYTPNVSKSAEKPNAAKIAAAAELDRIIRASPPRRDSLSDSRSNRAFSNDKGVFASEFVKQLASTPKKPLDSTPEQVVSTPDRGMDKTKDGSRSGPVAVDNVPGEFDSPPAKQRSPAERRWKDKKSESTSLSMFPQSASPKLSTKQRNQQEEEEGGIPSSSSIDAFEASFSTQFPASFSVASKAADEQQPRSEIYNPFLQSPKKPTPLSHKLALGDLTPPNLNGNRFDHRNGNFGSETAKTQSAVQNRVLDVRKSHISSPMEVKSSPSPEKPFPTETTLVGNKQKGTPSMKTPAANIAVGDQPLRPEKTSAAAAVGTPVKTPAANVAVGEQLRPQKTGAAAARARYERALQPRGFSSSRKKLQQEQQQNSETTVNNSTTNTPSMVYKKLLQRKAARDQVAVAPDLRSNTNGSWLQDETATEIAKRAGLTPENLASPSDEEEALVDGSSPSSEKGEIIRQ